VLKSDFLLRARSEQAAIPPIGVMKSRRLMSDVAYFRLGAASRPPAHVPRGPP